MNDWLDKIIAVECVIGDIALFSLVIYAAAIEARDWLRNRRLRSAAGL